MAGAAKPGPDVAGFCQSLGFNGSGGAFHVQTQNLCKLDFFTIQGPKEQVLHKDPTPHVFWDSPCLGQCRILMFMWPLRPLAMQFQGVAHGCCCICYHCSVSADDAIMACSAVVTTSSSLLNGTQTTQRTSIRAAYLMVFRVY